MGMVGKTCLPSNAYYPRTPDYTLCSGAQVCWSEQSDSSFVYGFMSLDYGSGTMTTNSFKTLANAGRDIKELFTVTVNPETTPLFNSTCKPIKIAFDRRQSMEAISPRVL